MRFFMNTRTYAQSRPPPVERQHYVSLLMGNLPLRTHIIFAEMVVKMYLCHEKYLS